MANDDSENATTNARHRGRVSTRLDYHEEWLKRHDEQFTNQGDQLDKHERWLLQLWGVLKFLGVLTGTGVLGVLFKFFVLGGG